MSSSALSRQARAEAFHRRWEGLVIMHYLLHGRAFARLSRRGAVSQKRFINKGCGTARLAICSQGFHNSLNASAEQLAGVRAKQRMISARSCWRLPEEAILSHSFQAVLRLAEQPRQLLVNAVLALLHLCMHIDCIAFGKHRTPNAASFVSILALLAGVTVTGIV